MVAQTSQPLQELETLEGTVERILFQNPTNLYVVCTVIYKSEFGMEETKATGYSAGIREGEKYRFAGSWVRHPKYGRQFSFSEAELIPPVGRDGIARYLAGMVDGVGPARAQKIIDTLGENALDKIKKNPAVLNSPELSFLTENQRNEIIQALLENVVVAELADLICRHGIGRGVLNRIYNRFGADSVKAIKENPYILTGEVWGIGFKTADLIAQHIGIPPNSLHRVEAAVSYLLREIARDGHCFLTPNGIVQRLIEGKGLLENSGVTVDRIAQAVQKLINRESLVREGHAIYLSEIYYSECSVAGKIKKLLAGAEEMDIPPQEEIHEKIAAAAMEQKYGVTYERKQHEAIRTALVSPISIITGGPGTGKTTVIQAICDIYAELHPEYNIYLAAPTGRASKRMSETTGRPASTIHRLLKYQPDSGMFEYGEGNPLPGPGLVVVDEASMVDIVLAGDLFDALARHQLVLVGDVDQLPSVGPGSVLRDLIASGRIPTVELEFNYRQAGGSKVAEFAAMVRTGAVPPLASVGDYTFIEVDGAEAAANIILKLVAQALKDGYGQMDFQVLAPMRKGEAGVKKLNDRIRDLIREKNGESHSNLGGFVVGDKVMVIRNHYGLEVFNGDLGEVVEIDRGVVTVDFGDCRKNFSGEDLDILTLAYACTVHKSQGSEFPLVFMPLVRHHYMMLQRNLLYTGMTRAKKRLVLVGDPWAIRKAVHNDVQIKRLSKLKEKIQKCETKEKPQFKANQ